MNIVTKKQAHKLFCFFTITFIISIYAVGQTYDNTQKLNEARYALENGRDCALANKILNEISSANNDPLYIFYKYQIFSGENIHYQTCSDLFFIDSAIYYLEKYLQYFPANFDLQKKLIGLKIKQRKVKSMLLEKPVYSRSDYRFEKQSGYVFRDSLFMFEKDGFIIIRAKINPFRNLSFSIDNQIDYDFQHHKKDHNSNRPFPVWLYLTIKSTTPLSIYEFFKYPNANPEVAPTFKARIYLDSITVDSFYLVKEYLIGNKKKTTQYQIFSAQLCHDAVNNLKQRLESLKDIRIKAWPESESQDSNTSLAIFMDSSSKSYFTLGFYLDWVINDKAGYKNDCCFIINVEGSEPGHFKNY